MDTRLPYFDGQKDFLAYIHFLGNRKEYAAYDKKLSEKIAKFAAAIKTYGKIKEIDRLHEEAELLVLRGKSAFTEREETLVAGEAAFKKTMAEQTKALAEKERVMQGRLNVQSTKLRDRQMALQDREEVVGGREAAAQSMHVKAKEAQQAAQEAKREADDMVARMVKATAA